jgi:hypothetical protein
VFDGPEEEQEGWTVSKRTAQNVFVVAGAYYLSNWLEMLAILTATPITNHLTFTGEFEGVFVMPVVLGIPSTVAMVIAGASAAWLVDSPRPILWALVPALAYAMSSALAPHWVRTPGTASDRIFLAIRVLLPATAWIAGAATVSAWRRHSRASQK